MEVGDSEELNVAGFFDVDKMTLVEGEMEEPEYVDEKAFPSCALGGHGCGNGKLGLGIGLATALALARLLLDLDLFELLNDFLEFFLGGHEPGLCFDGSDLVL